MFWSFQVCWLNVKSNHRSSARFRFGRFLLTRGSAVQVPSKLLFQAESLLGDRCLGRHLKTWSPLVKSRSDFLAFKTDQVSSIFDRPRETRETCIFHIFRC